MCGLLLDELADRFELAALKALAEATARRLGESEASRAAGDPAWWKPREATMLAVGTLNDALIETEADAKSANVPAPFSAQHFLRTVMDVDLAPGAEATVPSFLRGRALWVAARLAPERRRTRRAGRSEPRSARSPPTRPRRFASARVARWRSTYPSLRATSSCRSSGPRTRVWEPFWRPPRRRTPRETRRRRRCTWCSRRCWWWSRRTPTPPPRGPRARARDATRVGGEGGGSAPRRGRAGCSRGARGDAGVSPVAARVGGADARRGTRVARGTTADARGVVPRHALRVASTGRGGGGARVSRGVFRLRGGARLAKR